MTSHRPWIGLVTLAGAFLLPLPAQAAGDGVHWGYTGHEGPAHWGELSPDYALCKDGRMQSPVDLASATTRADVRVNIAYRPVPLTVLHNGHTVQFNVDNGSAITLHGKSFKLLQVHFHTPSEHTVAGKAHALEAHFVHAAGDGALAVIGVFFGAGGENAALTGLIRHVPMEAAKPRSVAGVTMNPRAILPRAPQFYRYMGSLTTPPCSEGVNWLVVEALANASAAQIAALRQAMGANARPSQPANNRLLIEPN